MIDLKTRRVEVAGIIQQPNGDWMKQIARNLTDVVDGFLKKTEYLIHDRAESASVECSTTTIGRRREESIEFWHHTRPQTNITQATGRRLEACTTVSSPAPRRPSGDRTLPDKYR